MLCIATHTHREPAGNGHGPMWPLRRAVGAVQRANGDVPLTNDVVARTTEEVRRTRIPVTERREAGSGGFRASADSRAYPFEPRSALEDRLTVRREPATPSRERATTRRRFPSTRAPKRPPSWPTHAVRRAHGHCTAKDVFRFESRVAARDERTAQPRGRPPTTRGIGIHGMIRMGDDPSILRFASSQCVSLLV